MPRRTRIKLGYPIPGPAGPQRVDWFEEEINQLIRRSRKAASQHLAADPLGIRGSAKSVITRSRITLAYARAHPELVSALWNERMLGYHYQTLRYNHNWGTDLMAAKRQRDGARSGAETSRMLRARKARARAAQVLREAIRTQRQSHNRELTQRSFSLAVARTLNRKDPPPDQPYTADNVRYILRKEHFFAE